MGGILLEVIADAVAVVELVPADEAETGDAEPVATTFTVDGDNWDGWVYCATIELVSFSGRYCCGIIL